MGGEWRGGAERRGPRDFLPFQGACVASLLATRASRLTTPAHRGWLSQWPCTSRGRCCRKPLPWPRLGGWLAAAVTPERFPPGRRSAGAEEEAAWACRAVAVFAAAMSRVHGALRSSVQR